MTKCTLTLDSGAIAVRTPYDPSFVYELKRYIPAGERKWDGTKKLWMIAPQHGQTIQNICMSVFNELPLLPNMTNIKPTVTQRIIDVRYIGITKDRGADERSAYGYYRDGWNVIFPESVLRGWFDAPAQPDEQPTLYSVLNVKRNATTDEIKSGYRRMVFQWHPDRCREPNAQDQFIAIQHAYDVLKDEVKRERYNAGLMFEDSLRNTPKSGNRFAVDTGYRSPLRCGLIMCEGIESMGLFSVSKIFAWADITDNQGRTLVVSWQKGDDHFTEVWA